MSNLPTLKAWIDREADRDWEWELGMGDRDQEMMLQFWENHRPKMFRLLKGAKLHEKLAKILEERALEQLHRTRQVMPPTDAHEQAQKDWYLMEEEDPDKNPEEDLLDLIQRESTST